MRISKADIYARALVWLSDRKSKKDLEILSYLYPFTFAEVVAVWAACGHDIGTARHALSHAAESGGSVVLAALEAERRSGQNVDRMAKLSLRLFGRIGSDADTTKQGLLHYMLCEIAVWSGTPVREVLIESAREWEEWKCDPFDILISKRHECLTTSQPTTNYSER